MKNFRSYKAEKYSEDKFKEVEDRIYQTADPFGTFDGDIYVTSLTFELENDRYGEEDGSPQFIPQVPIEGLLDEFSLFVTDFYEDLNNASETVCYQEFGSFEIEDIRKLRTLIGKKFYAEPYEEDGEEYYKMVTE